MTEIASCAPRHLAGAPRTGPTNRHLTPAQHNLTRRMPRSIRLARRLMRIPWPTDGGPILFQHGFEYLQARRDDQLLELGLRINEDIDQRQVPWRRGYRLATARDCARLLLHGGSLLGGLHLGFVTGRIARPVKSRRFKFQQLLGQPPRPGDHRNLATRVQRGQTEERVGRPDACALCQATGRETKYRYRRTLNRSATESGGTSRA